MKVISLINIHLLKVIFLIVNLLIKVKMHTIYIMVIIIFQVCKRDDFDVLYDSPEYMFNNIGKENERLYVQCM